MTPQRQRLYYWLYVLGGVTLIYSTLYIVRPICEFLKEKTPFDLLMNIMMIIFLSILGMQFWMKKSSINLSQWFLLLLVLTSYVIGLIVLPHPEEKIHFIEYGLLAFLVYRALRLDCRMIPGFILAFILVTLLGWGDEGIQHLLPNRYYQIQDVVLNSFSGFLGLILTVINENISE